jgi:hypothetical protein
MTWLYLIPVAYILIGFAYSTRLRCWWRGKHDVVRMFVKDKQQDDDYAQLLVDHCKWCGNRKRIR